MDHTELRELLRWADIMAESDSFLFDLRDGLLQHGMISESIAVSRRIVLRIPPENRKAKSLAWSNLASFLYQVNRIDEALAAALMAKQLNRENDAAWEYMALSYWRKHEFHDAIAAYHQALKVCPSNELARRSFLSNSCALLLREAGRDGDSMRYKLQAESLNERAEREDASSDAIPAGRTAPSGTP